MNVLVVEDEKLMNWFLTRTLTEWGFETKSVYTAREALEALYNFHFDVFLLDYQLPDQTGLEVARKIRTQQPCARIYMITAFQLSELPLGGSLIDGYFNKPVDLMMLHEALERAGIRGQKGLWNGA